MGILHARQTHLKGKEDLVKYKGCHHKEAMWMKLAYLDHLFEMVNKFEYEQSHKLGVKKIQQKKKKTHLRMA
jgi:hypothetical protein